MIEQLESRTFFSTTPHAALTTLRQDVASIGAKFKTMIAANNSAIANLQSDTAVFPTTHFADNAVLRRLNFQFASHLTTLANDYDNFKVIFGQDITQLINRSNYYNRHPTSTVGLAVQASQQQLTSQGAVFSSTLSKDASQLQTAYIQALALVASIHPLDTAFTARISHITTALNTNIAAIQAAASTVAATDIPNFITALEPNGVITS